MISCGKRDSVAEGKAPTVAGEYFTIESLPIEIHCPDCNNEMVHDQNSLPLAESPRGVMFECGKCQKVSQWSISGDPMNVKQVPVTWGKKL